MRLRELQRSILVIFLALGLARAESTAFPGWNIAITPYLWLPAADGTLRYDPGSGIPSTPVLDSDKNLGDFFDSGFMMGAEVKKDRWVGLTDFIYVDFANQSSLAGTQMNTSLIGKAWTLLGGYRALEGPVEVDVLGGVRYFGLSASTNWQLGASAGTVSDSTKVWDGVLAMRGRVLLGKTRLFFPYYADVGTGQSKITWQASGGAGYAFQWLDINLTYRTIYYDEREDGLINDLSFTGPAVAFSFRF